MQSNRKQIYLGVGLLATIPILIYLVHGFYTQNAGLDRPNNFYLNLLENKDSLEREYSLVFQEHWKKTLQEQQVYFQQRVQELARSENIQEILTINPLESKQSKQCSQLFLQLNLRCSYNALVRFLYRISVDSLAMRTGKISIYCDEAQDQKVRVQLTLSSLWMSVVEN